LATADEPDEVVITGLSADTRYYYRMIYDGDGDVDDGDFITRDEHTFHTQRAEGEAFTFTITSDSHVNIMLGNSATWQQTMTNVVSDNPDFHIDLGDTFAMDSVSTVAGAETAYLYQRQFFDLVGNSAPIFLTAGNHEQQEGWHLDDTTNPHSPHRF
jgi:phosphodiesterase/alkaline phosphatase D-like protein